MEAYENFASRTDVNCAIFGEAHFECDYDEMEYTAQFNSEKRHIDSSYKLATGKYYYDSEKNLCLPEWSTSVAFDIKMLYNEGKCIFYPRINVRCRFRLDEGYRTIERIYVKNGENRYVAPLANVSTITERAQYGSNETDYATLVLGPDDVSIFREIAKGKFPSKIRMGSGQGTMEFTKKDKKDIASFLDVCERAGVFEQPAFKEVPASFQVITKFNP